MSLERFFTRFGQPSQEASGSINYHFIAPAAIKTGEDVAWQDKRAAEMIATCQRMIATMQEYRQALAARYGQLETMAYTDTLKLKREKRYDGLVEFRISHIRTFEDGTQTSDQLAYYKGKDRAQALKDFAQLCKEHPGYEVAKDIERGRWER